MPLRIKPGPEGRKEGLFSRLGRFLRWEQQAPRRESMLGPELLAATHLATVLGNRDEPDEIAYLTAYAASEMLGCPALVLLPESGERLRVRAHAGLQVDVTGLPFDPPPLLAGTTRLEPLQFPDLLDMGGELSHRLSGGGLRAAILVPMLARGISIGAILVAHPDAHWFSPKEIGLLTLGASLASQALQNSELRAQVRASAAAHRTTQELTEQLLEHVGTGVVVVTPAHRVTLLNRTGRQTMHELDGYAWNVGDDLSRDPDLKHPIRDALEQQETELRQVAYKERTIEVQSAPLRGSYGELVGVMALFRDISRVQSMEQRMRRAERLAAVGEMAAAAAHEIRNPLTAIRGFIQLLQHRSQEQSTQYYEIVLREIDRIDVLVRDMLLLAKPIDPNRQRIELVQLIEETLMPTLTFLTIRGVTVQVQSAGPVHMLADAGLLRSVVLNLVANAADAMPDGGPVIISVDRGEQRVSLRIQDTGSGIAPEHLGRLFTPFFTTKESGTGLGLVLCHRIVEAHGGHIEVQSKVGEGTLFTIDLPIGET